MASNINVTEGSGKVVGTEDIGGVQYQKIKLVGGETGSTSVLGVNPDRSMNVSVIGIPTVNVTGKSSVSGTVGASAIGTVPVTQSGVSATSIQGVASVFQAGTWITSIITTQVGLYAPTASFVSAVTSVITSTSQTSVLATAPGAQRNYVTQVLITNGAATGTFVDIMDGPNVIYSGYAAANGGGYALSFTVPLKQNNTVQSVDIKARTQASIIAAMSGYTGA